MHHLLISPLDGIQTASFPQVPSGEPDPAGHFQPLALIVPYENGTQPALPSGFAGPKHLLPPIVGDKRVVLIKKKLTFFHGSHFSLPVSMLS